MLVGADVSVRDNFALIATEAEAARLLRLSARTLQRLRLDGGGPPFIPLTPSGARIGYRIADLDTWLRARAVSSTAAATVAAQADAA